MVQYPSGLHSPIVILGPGWVDRITSVVGWPLIGAAFIITYAFGGSLIGVLVDRIRPRHCRFGQNGRSSSTADN